MKSSPSSEAPSGTVPFRPGNSGDDQSPRSLFSLLLDIETQFRAEARRDPSAGRRSPEKCRTLSNQGLRTSRYIDKSGVLQSGPSYESLPEEWRPPRSCNEHPSHFHIAHPPSTSDRHLTSGRAVNFAGDIAGLIASQEDKDKGRARQAEPLFRTRCESQTVSPSLWAWWME